MWQGANLLPGTLVVLGLFLRCAHSRVSTKTIARFLRMFLFARSALLSRSLAASMERTQKPVLVGSALMRKELLRSGLMVLVTLILAGPPSGGVEEGGSIVDWNNRDF